MLKKYTLVLLFAALAVKAFSHDPGTGQLPLHKWHLNNHRHLHASLLLMKNDTVFLENEQGAVSSFPLAAFSKDDQHFVKSKMAHIEQLNQTRNQVQPVKAPERHPASTSIAWFWGLIFCTTTLLSVFLLWKKKRQPAFALSLSGIVLLCAFKTDIGQKLLGTDPVFMDAAFAPFKPHVATHWDDNWFYVESNGIPTTHPMMAGITKWQQQVPIQQCYMGANAWQIPRNPVFAATPVPVNQQHFLRGAVAIAANGIPIFNPYTNTGIDALLDGQLDQWGGHCGRADDYHYHVAPMFLDTQSIDILPIAFALDGFPVYAGLEPDGAPILPLDANHGHTDTNTGYHYHGTATSPYMIGNMVGQVTEDATMQIIPQAKATPVRPSLTPLNGATITDCTPNAAGNGYTLTYTRNGETYKVEYSWTLTGVYTYNFIGPAGATTETYNGHAPCAMLTATQDVSALLPDLQVFPNPGAGGFFLKIKETDDNQPRRVSVFDANGKPVFQQDHPAAMLEISGLSRGVYFLQINFDQGNTSRKILVQ